MTFVSDHPTHVRRNRLRSAAQARVAAAGNGSSPSAHARSERSPRRRSRGDQVPLAAIAPAAGQIRPQPSTAPQRASAARLHSYLPASGPQLFRVF